MGGHEGVGRPELLLGVWEAERGDLYKRPLGCCQHFIGILGVLRYSSIKLQKDATFCFHRSKQNSLILQCLLWNSMVHIVRTTSRSVPLNRFKMYFISLISEAQTSERLRATEPAHHSYIQTVLQQWGVKLITSFWFMVCSALFKRPHFYSIKSDCIQEQSRDRYTHCACLPVV